MRPNPAGRPSKSHVSTDKANSSPSAHSRIVTVWAIPHMLPTLLSTRLNDDTCEVNGNDAKMTAIKMLE